MTRLSATYRLRYTLIAGVSALVLFAPSSTVHGTEAAAKLRVNPIPCVIDVTQDGSNQTLQVPTESCIPLIPELTTPDQPGQATPPLPFAGADPVSIQQPDAMNAEPAAWSPVATAQTGTAEAKALTDQFTANMAIGATAAVLTAAAAVDVFVLESSHTKRVMRRTWRRFLSVE